MKDQEGSNRTRPSRV
uniref:Uncharacterized protein n=1 Tax=Rhizophora mucronata TaxID=61149 RepID=A0A2P2N1Y9_RHIMU